MLWLVNFYKVLDFKYSIFKNWEFARENGTLQQSYGR